MVPGDPPDTQPCPTCGAPAEFRMPMPRVVVPGMALRAKVREDNPW
jgi:hypothetical protein